MVPLDFDRAHPGVQLRDYAAVTYVILPGTKTAALPRSAAEVQSQGRDAFQKAGIPPV